MNRWRIVKTDKEYQLREHVDAALTGNEVAKAVGSCEEAVAVYEQHAKGQRGLSAADKLWNSVYAETFAETDDDLMASLAAEGAVKKAFIVGFGKSADQPIVKGWGLIYTDAQRKDLQKTYFDHDTQTLLEYYEGSPLWYEHGLDRAYGDDPIGKRISARQYPRGIWVEHLLHTTHRLFPRTETEAKSGILTYSSDTSGLHVAPRMRRDGGYGSWPLIGFSLTKEEAEPALGHTQLKGKKLFPGIKDLSADKQGEARKAQTRHEGDAPDNADSSKTISEGKTMEITELLKQLAEAFDCDPTVVEVKSHITALQEDYAARADDEELAEDEATMFGLDEGSTVLAGKSVLGNFLKAIEPPKIKVSALGKAAKLIAAGKSRKAAPVEDDDEDDDTPVMVNRDQDDDEDRPAPSRGRYRRESDVSAEGRVRSEWYGKSYRSPYQSKHIKTPGVPELMIGLMNRKSDTYMKSLGFINGTNGGWLVRREQAQEMLPRFYANTILDKLGATVVPMPGIESLLYHKEKAGMDAYWRGERQTAVESDADWGYVQLNLKELVVATTIPKRLLRAENVNLEASIMRDMAKAARLKYDIAALSGTGSVTGSSTGAEPLGLLNDSRVNSVTLGSGNGDVPGVEDFLKRWLAIAEEDVPESDSWGVAMSLRERIVMENTRDLTGQKLEPTAFTLGNRVASTSQIAATGTLGTSSDVSNIYFGDWQYLIVGMGQDVEFSMSEHVDIKKGLVYLEASLMVDIGIAYPEAFEILKGVRGFVA